MVVVEDEHITLPALESDSEWGFYTARKCGGFFVLYYVSSQRIHVCAHSKGVGQLNKALKYCRFD